MMFPKKYYLGVFAMSSKNKMPEAEVSLRLAIGLLKFGIINSNISVSLDGANVRVQHNTIFDVVEFLRSMGFHNEDSSRFQGQYSSDDFQYQIEIDSVPGQGDVVAYLKGNKRLYVESKKGPLINKKSNPEYKLMREAIGQLMTVEDVSVEDVLAIAIPHSNKFNELALRWRKAPLIKQLGIRILTVDRENRIYGLDKLEGNQYE